MSSTIASLVSLSHSAILDQRPKRERERERAKRLNLISFSFFTFQWFRLRSTTRSNTIKLPTNSCSVRDSCLILLLCFCVDSPCRLTSSSASSFTLTASFPKLRSFNSIRFARQKSNHLAPVLIGRARYDSFDFG
jgi:hypothetical protein